MKVLKIIIIPVLILLSCGRNPDLTNGYQAFSEKRWADAIDLLRRVKENDRNFKYANQMLIEATDSLVALFVHRYERMKYELDSVLILNQLEAKDCETMEVELHRIKNELLRSPLDQTLRASIVYKLEPLENSISNSIVLVTTGKEYRCKTCSQVIKDQTYSKKVKYSERDKYHVETIYKGFCSKICALLDKHPSWSREEAELVSKGKVSIGMTTEMVRAAWGAPWDVNRSVGSWGVNEQWVYGSRYLYFEDGILTSFQD